MDNFRLFIEKHLIPITDRIGKQRHLQATRDGIIHVLPLILIGSFFLLLGQPPGDYLMKHLTPYAPAILIPYRMTFGLISIYVVATVSYALAKSYKMDGISTSIISVVCFFLAACPRVDGGWAGPFALLNIPKSPDLGWNMPIKYFGTDGLFLAIIMALLVVEIIRYLQNGKLMFKMPEGVPEGVSKAFESIIPSFLTILFFWALRDLVKFDIPAAVIAVFSPIKQLGDSLFAVIGLTIVDSTAWFAGIHPVAIIGPFARPIWLALFSENADKFLEMGKGAVLPHIAVDQFYFWFVWIGGSGATLGLIGHLLMAKSKFLKQLGKICLMPGIFNINEPLVFGLPIVANPLMIIPFALAPIVNGIIAYSAFYFNLVQRPYITAPWTLPVPLGAWMSTGGDWRAVLLSLVVIAVSMLIYYPFIKVYDKRMLLQEQQNQEQQQEQEAVKNEQTA